jgi:hypothetical protein
MFERILYLRPKINEICTTKFYEVSRKVTYKFLNSPLFYVAAFGGIILASSLARNSFEQVGSISQYATALGFEQSQGFSNLNLDQVIPDRNSDFRFEEGVRRVSQVTCDRSEIFTANASPTTVGPEGNIDIYGLAKNEHVGMKLMHKTPENIIAVGQAKVDCEGNYYYKMNVGKEPPKGWSILEIWDPKKGNEFKKILIR